MQNVIIHTATRVIRRITTDQNPPIAADESIISLVNTIDLAPEGTTQFWKLDITNKKIAASSNDIDLAQVDTTLEMQKKAIKQQALKNATSALASDNTLAVNMQNFFKSFNDIL